MRKIVLKRNNTNILLVAVVFGVIFGIIGFPLSSYLVDIGLSVRDSTIITLCIANPIALILTNLIVKIEPTKPNLKGLIMFYTAIGFLVVCGGVVMRQIFFACAGAFLIIGIWDRCLRNHGRMKQNKKWRRKNAVSC